jgi:hypothetical protein
MIPVATKDAPRQSDFQGESFFIQLISPIFNHTQIIGEDQ